MLQVKKSSVKDGPEDPPPASKCTGLADLLFRSMTLLVAMLCIGNVAVAYRDARARQIRMEKLERELDDVLHRNKRLRTRIEGLSSDPALVERWLREQDELLPGEEVILPHR